MAGFKKVSVGVRAAPAHVRHTRTKLGRRSVQLSAPDAAQLIRDAVSAGGELWVSGSGSSMHPTVRHADPVLVAPLRSPVRRGQIILVPFASRLMLHRVVEVQGDIVITRGDAQQRNDAPIGRTEVIAQALAVRNGDSLSTLRLTRRFGVMPVVRFLLREAYRRVRLVRATRRHENANLTGKE